MPTDTKAPKVDPWQTVRDWREESDRYARQNPRSYLTLDAQRHIFFVTDADVVMSLDQWEKMDEYSTSVPTGVYKDKIWRVNEEPYGGRSGLFMGHYREYDPPQLHHIQTVFYRVSIFGVGDCAICDGLGWVAYGRGCPVCDKTGRYPAHRSLGYKREPSWWI